ncbi:hypothetical protein CHO01_37000 [Cellulomonas hominis]|uniref:Uncharacterized protein n=1 Tax=Cellulomonas hominis TaxID=156981 RepID=A0A511FJ30_9CELL|nr:hypothetical protein [Cellulomonas hominis]MBB5474714.1 hypothetical protein [Cellulomonas hominis]NKY06793.1 hypothetical protein [Cellulomonas hominis]GEL48584.1 hypothetical protein CHO01_37000 [Cellulomonas hominis]
MTQPHSPESIGTTNGQPLPAPLLPQGISPSAAAMYFGRPANGRGITAQIFTEESWPMLSDEDRRALLARPGPVRPATLTHTLDDVIGAAPQREGRTHRPGQPGVGATVIARSLLADSTPESVEQEIRQTLAQLGLDATPERIERLARIHDAMAPTPSPEQNS